MKGDSDQLEAGREHEAALEKEEAKLAATTA
jgi:hypothetical protein